LKRVLIFGIVFIILIAILLIYLNYSRHVDTGKLVLSGVIEAEEILVLSGSLYPAAKPVWPICP